MTARLEAHPLVAIVREELAGLPPEAWDSVVVATGPLTSPALSQAVLELTGEGQLAFFDAIAPIVHVDSLDRSIVFAAGRFGESADYLNCPMDRAEYEAFVSSLVAADVYPGHEWENEIGRAHV